MNAFVGRVDELAALAQICDAAIRGEVAAAVVVGDAGSGKSCLLREAATRTPALRQFRVFGFEPESEVPLAGASEFLRALSTATSQGRQLEELVFGAPPEDASPLDPVRVFESAHRAIGDIEPALLLIDDLQWLDGLSLALCHYLARAAESTGEPFALIAVARPSTRVASFAASLRHLLPPERVREFDLGPLSDAEALELVNELAPHLADAPARVVAARSGGSPFWLEALVRDGGADVDEDRLVTARLRGTSADAATLLALLSIAARPLALADAAELSDWDEARTQEAARELVGRGVAADSAGALRLAHDLIRDAAAREIPDEQRARIHVRVSEWLVENAGDDIRRLREALAHRHVAGLESLDLANRLVHAPRRTLLGEDGLALLLTVADAGDPFDEAVLGLNEEVAALASALGRHDVALERNLLLADRLSDPPGRARALLEAAKAAFALDRRSLYARDENVRAQTYLTQAREIDAADDALEVELALQQATLDMWTDGKEAAGRALAYETAARAQRLFDVDKRVWRVYVEALRLQYEAALQEDDPQAMVPAAERRTAVARGLDEEEHLTAVLASARGLRRMGRVTEALERSERVYREAQARVFPRLTLDGGYWLGTFLLQRGRVADADDVVAATVELASRIGDEARGRHAVERLACEVEFYRQDWRRGLQRLLAYARGATEHGRIELHQLAALWIAFVGGPALKDEVLAQIAVTRGCADAVGCNRCGSELRLGAADALVHVGCRAEAAASLAEWVSMQARPQLRDCYLQRRVEALLQEPVSAEALEDVACEADHLGFALDALWTRLDLASALVATDTPRAKDVLAAVAAVADTSGAQTIAEVAGKRLRSLGVRTWQRGAGGAAALTERESAIAHMIAEVASNPEIAQKLFLSRKTVERHVSNVLKKTGVRNRTELAARVADLKLEGAHR